MRYGLSSEFFDRLSVGWPGLTCRRCSTATRWTRHPPRSCMEAAAVLGIKRVCLLHPGPAPAGRRRRPSCASSTCSGTTCRASSWTDESTSASSTFTDRCARASQLKQMTHGSELELELSLTPHSTQYRSFRVASKSQKRPAAPDNARCYSNVQFTVHRLT